MENPYGESPSPQHKNCLLKHYIFLQQLFPPRITAFLDKSLHFLRASTCGYKKRIWHIDNHKIVDTKAGNKSSRSRNDNTTRHLLSQNYEVGSEIIKGFNELCSYQADYLQVHVADSLRQGVDRPKRKNPRRHPNLKSRKSNLLNRSTEESEATNRRWLEQLPPCLEQQQVPQRHCQWESFQVRATLRRGRTHELPPRHPTLLQFS